MHLAVVLCQAWRVWKLYVARGCGTMMMISMVIAVESSNVKLEQFSADACNAFSTTIDDELHNVSGR